MYNVYKFKICTLYDVFNIIIKDIQSCVRFLRNIVYTIIIIISHHVHHMNKYHKEFGIKKDKWSRENARYIHNTYYICMYTKRERERERERERVRKRERARKRKRERERERGKEKESLRNSNSRNTEWEVNI